MKTIEIARQVLPASAIIAGGWGPTYEPEKVLRAGKKAVDCVVIGEGELTLLELVKRIEKGQKDFNDIDGLAFLDQNDKVVFTKPRKLLMDLDILPWPAWHLLFPDFSKYRGMQARYKEMPRPVATMISARGCPHRCTFCSLSSKVWRWRSAKDVVSEMEFYHDKFGAGSIQLYDDEFVGMSPKQNERVEELCDEIIKRGLHRKLAFLVQGRCSSFINLKTLKKMREANFVWVWWGVESGSQKVLDSVKKDIKVEDVYKTFDLAKQAGIKSLMFIMVGFPGETPADIKLTIDLIKGVRPDNVAVHITTPHPGSELRKYLEEHNMIETYDYYKANHRHGAIHHTNELASDEIKKYYQLLVFRFEQNTYGGYFKFLLKSLTTADGWKQLPKRIKTVIRFFLSWLKVKIA